MDLSYILDMQNREATRTRQGFLFIRGGTLQMPDGSSVAIGPDPVTIGRATTASICLEDPEVSSLHCELRATDSGVMLRDLGSTNGTHVGNVAVLEVRLTGPCNIRVGTTDMQFRATSKKQFVDTGTESAYGPLVGVSHPMRRLYQVLRRVAPTELSVLIMGETGTGKELVAKAIHETSARQNAPFVVLDCGSIPAMLAESILFGHEKGSFTGATARKAGVFLEANTGTLFLDEVGELPEETQPKLLRAVAERAVKRVGGSRYEPVDVRVIAATRRDLRREMNANRFRSDLFFRLAQVTVELAPLRERRADLQALVERACQRIRQPDAVPAVLQHIEARFPNYDWPGNVRELMNVASVLAALDDGDGEDTLEYLLPLEARQSGAPPKSAQATAFAEAKRSFEESYFKQLQESTDGNISEIARKCGLARHQVRAHLRKLGLIQK